jgi:hypothetical protein
MIGIFAGIVFNNDDDNDDVYYCTHDSGPEQCSSACT